MAEYHPRRSMVIYWWALAALITGATVPLAVHLAITRDTSVSPLARLVLFCIFVFGIAMFVDRARFVGRTRVRADADGLDITTKWGKSLRLRWEEIEAARDHSFEAMPLGRLHVQTLYARGRLIWIPSVKPAKDDAVFGAILENAGLVMPDLEPDRPDRPMRLDQWVRDPERARETLDGMQALFSRRSWTGIILIQVFLVIAFVAVFRSLAR